ncbi:protein FAR1-RELATED SEQUENCE 11-like [Arachis hypogaea]|uniref:protein FAR1-RELATED SEQUENCE 11-like n=1 Tax=Arachis hypogaea TaxID=3818 RepID=UPI000DECF5B4|nr:protein FAR1-RELATED SEQUENCE 5-like [Arachis hypogaea]
MDEQYQEDDEINQQKELSEDTLEAAYAVDSVQDITTLNFNKNCAEEIGKCHFSTLQLAFDFYLKYSKSKGFSARKSKTFKNSIDEIYKQKFVCHRKGFKEEKYYTMKKRKKEPRLETRTRCEARMDVKFVPETGRKISKADIMQMMNMLKSGISTSQIFGLLASQASGYEFVGYSPRDMYNEIARQRHQIPGDAARVLKKLEDMRLKDPQLYFKACHDSRGLLHNLFWSDGISQLDYQLVRDVIAFDATYKKN